MLSENAGQIMEEETEVEAQAKKGNLLDYRDVLLTIKISEEHTLQYNFNQLFVVDYTEEFSETEGIGEYSSLENLIITDDYTVQIIKVISDKKRDLKRYDKKYEEFIKSISKALKKQ